MDQEQVEGLNHSRSKSLLFKALRPTQPKQNGNCGYDYQEEVL